MELCAELFMLVGWSYVLNSYVSRKELCTELFYAVIPNLFLYFLPFCYPYILLHFCFLLILYTYTGFCSLVESPY